jgi:RHS repeat-associated protein
VRYANGEVRLAVQDLSSKGFGLPWGHTRSYSNRLNELTEVARNPNGIGWFVREIPQLVQEISGSSSSTSVSVGVIGVVQDTRWFDWQVGDVWTPRFFFPERLEQANPGTYAEEFTFFQENGTRLMFYGFDSLIEPALQGQLKAVRDPFGHEVEATYNLSHQLAAFTQTGRMSSSTSSSSSSEVDLEPGTLQYIYDYVTGGDNGGRLSRATLYVDAKPLRRAQYTYYSSASTGGGTTGDLKSVSREQWDEGRWLELDRSHYRYYRSGETHGVAHGLKYVVGPEAYHRMAATGVSPETASDTQVAEYADQYLRYNSNREVTMETVNGGVATHQFAYVIASSPSTGYNGWTHKTTETLPDGKQWIVYTNFAGLVVFKVLKSSGGTDLAYEWFQFDDTNTSASYGACVLRALPSAISSYSEGDGTLMVNLASSGVVWVYDWYSSAEATPRKLKTIKFQNGNNVGSRVKLQDWTYENIGLLSQPVYFPKQVTFYQSAASGGTVPATYTLDYSRIGEALPGLITLTLPVNTASLNGSGSANSVAFAFGEYGAHNWYRDERGMLTRISNDPITWGPIQQIRDVNTNLVPDPYSDRPFGWDTPSGFGRNLVTDYRSDSQGRRLQVQGPAFEMDIQGAAATVRTARWTLYRDLAREMWSISGSVDGDGFTRLENPVSIRRWDSAYRMTDEIVAQADCREPLAGELPEAIPQSRWLRWKKTIWDDQSRLVAIRTYFNIPAEGEGIAGIHYYETRFEYDSGRRPKRVTDPDGTITRTVYDSKGRKMQTWEGTNDVGATDSDPSGGGGGAAAGNNMAKVATFEYDNNASVGDDLLTQKVRWTADSASRITSYAHDERERLWKVDGEEGYFAKYEYDNENRVKKVQIFNGDDSSSSNLVAQREISYDLLGRIFRVIRRGVDGSGAITSDNKSLTDEMWYDPAGNLIKILRQGRRSFEKFTYDGLGQVTAQYYCYNVAEYASPTYEKASQVADNTVVHQNEWVYDDGGSITQWTKRERFHDATGTGDLKTVLTEPKARVSYVAYYPDPLGRTVAQVDFGTNAAVTFIRPQTAPEETETVLVTRREFGPDGSVTRTIDARGIATRVAQDAAGRIVRVIENEQPVTDSAHANRATRYLYDGKGQLAEMVVENKATGDQVTRFMYGVRKSSTDSDFARGALVHSMVYPDGKSVLFQYNRQGEVKSKQDQLGTVHSYDYDKLGRWVQDRVTQLGTGVDGTVRRVGRTFTSKGRIAKITSYDSAVVGAGSVRNEIERTYNEYRQLLTEAQEVEGAVDGSTPVTTYGYATSGTNLLNTIRRTSISYPGTAARTLTFHYGTEDEIDDVLCRVRSIKQGSTSLAEYTYFGWEHRVVASYPENELYLTHLQQGDEPASDGGDPYVGYDRFGRVEQMRWRKGDSSPVDQEWIHYGFDAVGNRTWRRNLVAPESAGQDEAYAYDGLSQLVRLQRGVVNVNRSSVRGAPKWQEDWNFDATGNWHQSGTPGTSTPTGGGYRTTIIDATTTDQNRQHNRANDITGLEHASGTPWVLPFSDAAGNVTTMPNGNTPDVPLTCTYDAWQRLATVTPPVDGSTHRKYVYSYDGMGRRTAKQLSSGPISASSSVTSIQCFYSDQWQLLDMTTSTSVPGVGSTKSSARSQFLWGIRYPDDLVLQDSGSSSSTTEVPPPPTSLPTRSYFLHDYYHVTARVDRSTGNIVERLGYDAYGRSRVMNASFVVTGGASSSIFRFGAAFWDSETGLYLMRYRSLNPELGRLITRDPIGYIGGDLNLYRFVGNNPVSYLDPTGMSMEDLLMMGWTIEDLPPIKCCPPGEVFVHAWCILGYKSLMECVEDTARDAYAWNKYPFTSGAVATVAGVFSTAIGYTAAGATLFALATFITVCGDPMCMPKAAADSYKCK